MQEISRLLAFCELSRVGLDDFYDEHGLFNAEESKIADMITYITEAVKFPGSYIEANESCQTSSPFWVVYCLQRFVQLCGHDVEILVFLLFCHVNDP